MTATILITGGAGYIGSHLSLLLHHHNYQIIIIDSHLHNQSLQLPWATIYRGDFADTQLLSYLFTTYKISAVFHCAASIEVGESVKNPGLYYDNNVAKTITLLRTMIAHGVNKIIFSSSAAVYGNPQDILINEEHPCKPINPYGRTKLMCEDIIKDFHNAYGLQYVLLRYFNVAGAWPEYNLKEQHQPETHLIPLIIKALQDKQPFHIFGNNYDTKDGTAVRDYVHVRDVAEANFCALRHLEQKFPSDFFNVGSGEGKTILEIIEAMQEMSQQKIRVNYNSNRSGDPAILVADIAKIKNILCWYPNYSKLPFLLKSFLVNSIK